MVNKEETLSQCSNGKKFCLIDLFTHRTFNLLITIRVPYAYYFEIVLTLLVSFESTISSVSKNIFFVCDYFCSGNRFSVPECKQATPFDSFLRKKKRFLLLWKVRLFFITLLFAKGILYCVIYYILFRISNILSNTKINYKQKISQSFIFSFNYPL